MFKTGLTLQKGSGFWELEEDEDNNVKIIHQFHGEPGSEIPTWLANIFVVYQLFGALANLK